MQLEQKLQSLMSLNSQENVLSHLQKIFTHLLTSSKSTNLIEQFEDLSLQIKTQSQQQNQQIREADRSAISEKIRQLILKQVQENEEEKEGGVLGYVPNLVEELRIWQQVGVGFGEEETFLIFKSLVKLAQTRNTKQIRLWGKILASQKDYYVAEGVIEGVDDGELAPGTEPRGTGVNKFTYWVTNDQDWTELPLVTPEQIKTARQIKYIFSGFLDKKVVSNPQFFGLEKNLLRAQIARISFSTQIIPTGIMKVNEEDPKVVEAIEQDENYKPPTFEQLCSLSNWLHSSENILKEGRIAHTKPEIPEGEDEEQFMKKIEANDPFEVRLKPLSNDQSKEGIKNSWNLQVMGDSTYYLTQDGKKSKSNGIIYIRSLIWKGLSIVYQDKFQQSLYIGYGYKSDTKLFYPKFPQVMMDEPEEKQEQHEPRQLPVENKQEQVQQEDA